MFFIALTESVMKAKTICYISADAFIALLKRLFAFLFEKLSFKDKEHRKKIRGTYLIKGIR